jgi:hypothetical protein
VIGEGGGQQPVTVSVLVSTTATAPRSRGHQCIECAENDHPAHSL